MHQIYCRPYLAITAPNGFESKHKIFSLEDSCSLSEREAIPLDNEGWVKVQDLLDHRQAPDVDNLESPTAGGLGEGIKKQHH